MIENSKPLYEEKIWIYCNRCNKLVHKWLETFPVYDLNDDVHCIFCFNWLGGFFDIYGHNPKEVK